MAIGKYYILMKQNYNSDWERKSCYCGWNGEKTEQNNWLAHNYFLHMILNLLNIWIFRDLKIIHIEAMVNVKLLLYKNQFTYLQKCLKV